MSRNLTRIEGVSAVVAMKLNDIGIMTIEQLSNSSPAEISEAANISIESAERLISNAMNLLSQSGEPFVPSSEDRYSSKYSMKTTTQRETEQTMGIEEQEREREEEE
jgi:hypothetical protein